jgi:hypothetical protein
VTDTTQTPPDVKTLPAELLEVLERGHRGDPSALPQLRQVLEARPDLAAALGDLSKHAEEAVLGLVAGGSLTAAESIRRHADGLRQELEGEAPSRLEELLVHRVVLGSLWLHHGDLDVARRLAAGQGSTPGCREAERRLDRAHHRFLAAAQALVTARRFLRKGPSPLDLLGRPVAEQPPPLLRERCSRRHSPDLIPVQN